MSTLTSADFGELKRPTTRVHAPPGGGSSWSIGGDEPAAQPRNAKRAGNDVTPPPAPAPLKTGSSASAGVVSAAAATSAGVVRVALLKTKADAEIVDAMAHNALEKLQQNPSVRAETFTVASLDELPYAASKLSLARSGFDAVLVFGFLNTADPLFSVLAATLTQAFVDISVQHVKPVVRAMFVGEPRVAAVKAKGGYGAEFADNIDALARLGGFVGPLARAPDGREQPGGTKKPSVRISRGNVLPATLLGASRTVIQTLEALRNSLYEHGARSALTECVGG